MRNWQAFRTHHKNQTNLAMARRWLPTNKGMKPGSKASGDTVAYCSACQGAYVTEHDTIGRLLRYLRTEGKTHHFIARPDR